jgi:hypothetical protein
MRSSPDVANPFHVSLELKLSFKRSTTPGAVAVTVSSDADAVKVTLSEEDVRQRYPWDYADLTGHLKSRYSDFKENSKYHQYRKNLAVEKGLAIMRYLDPGQPKKFEKGILQSEYRAPVRRILHCPTQIRAAGGRHGIHPASEFQIFLSTCISHEGTP